MSLLPFLKTLTLWITTSSEPGSGLWGQALLPSGKDIFFPLALIAFPKIRPDPKDACRA